MANFEKAEAITGKIEGGYVNDPDDAGGETLDGISRVNHPEWRGWAAVDAIKKRVGTNAAKINEAARNDMPLQKLKSQFYKSEYWDKNNLDFVRYQSIANEVYDTGVNMGAKTSAKMLQEALNLCNKNGQSYADVEADGKIGSAGETMRALNNKANELAVLNTLNMLQGERYLDIMRKNKTQEKYWEGWLKRVVVQGKW